MIETDDDLRARLARVDPVLRMDSDLVEGGTVPDVKRLMAAPPASVRRYWVPPRRRLALVGATLALLFGAASAIIVTVGGDDPSGPPPQSTLELSLGSPGVTSASCLPFSADILRGMPVAFAGTVTGVDAESVSLTVDRWYAGGSAPVVSLRTPPGATSAALDGVEFRKGSRYLVAATEGTVNGCGFSGEDSPELARAYAQAYGG